MAIRVEGETLAGMLRSHGENELADQVKSFSEDQLTRIGRLGAYYAWSEDALSFLGSMGGARALSLATIDVIEGNRRDLDHPHTAREIAGGWSDQPDEIERARDREIRRHADERQRS
jgi:hypothetical protein